MKKFLYPFLAFTFVLAILLGYNSLIEEKGKVLSVQTSTIPEQSDVLTPEELASQYEEAAKSIINVLNALTLPVKDESDLTQRLDTLSELKETILDLRVPAQYQNLHLSFVSITEQLQKLLQNKKVENMNQDPSKISFTVDFSAIESKLEGVVNDYSWL